MSLSPSILKDPALADQGQGKIEFARQRMPVLQQLAAEFARERPLEGVRIAACLHVTTETANLCRALIEGGAELALCASNPLSTKDDVAAAIARDLGAGVYAIGSCDHETFYRQVHAALAVRPTLVLDDGADLTVTIHQQYPELLSEIRGATEVTSTGVLRLSNMARDGELGYPVIPVNDALTKHLFDNRYGTGQNTIDGILRATNILLAGKVVVVAGYGWCGKGVATRAHGMGARVVVSEVDPIRALEAFMEGFEVLAMNEAAGVGDIFVTVTGNRDVVTVEHMRLMKEGAVLCNSGHFDVEIDVAGLHAAATASVEMRPNLVQYDLGGKAIVLLAEGRLVGQGAAEAHPAEVMDMTFATLALAAVELVQGGPREPGIHQISGQSVERVARMKLERLGITLTELTAAQEAYLTAWSTGT
jgi:adenosylhomocysteinase